MGPNTPAKARKRAVADSNFEGQGLMPPTRWKYWVRGCLQAFEGILQVAWLHFADYDPHSASWGAICDILGTIKSNSAPLGSPWV